MQMRRFTRLTNGFNKTLEGLKAAMALHFAHYNIVRRNSAIEVTPAMEAGIGGELLTVPDFLTAAKGAAL